MYVVPVSPNAPLPKGLSRVKYRITNPLLRRAAALVANTSGFWDRTALPRVEAALQSSGEPTTKLLRGNFINLKTLESRNTPGAGFTFLSRKSWDEKTGIFSFWVVKK